GLELLQPHLLQVAIDQYLMADELSGITMVIVAYAGALTFRAGFNYLQFYLMQRAGHNALVDLRQEVFNHVQRRPQDFFHHTPVGRLMTRMTTDIESLQNALSSGIITMVGDLIMLVGIVGILLYKNWQLALVCFTVVPFLVGITAIFRYFLRQAFRDIRRKIARLYAHLQESITGMKVIQLFVRERVSAEEYEDINEEYRDANLRSIRYDAMLYAIVEAIGSITIGAIIWYGSGRVLNDF
ncbi:MAG: ABC transporter ATP-binding protein, partial [Bradymonadaceae bacterium]